MQRKPGRIEVKQMEKRGREEMTTERSAERRGMMRKRRMGED